MLLPAPGGPKQAKKLLILLNKFFFMNTLSPLLSSVICSIPIFSVKLLSIKS